MGQEAIRLPAEQDVQGMAAGAGMRKSRNRLELLAALSREFQPGRDLSVVLQRALGLTVLGLGASSGSLLLLDDDRTVVEAALAYAGTVRCGSGLDDTIRRGLAGWVVDNRQPALVTSTLEDPRWLRTDWEEAERAHRSAACVPIISGERVLGVLTVVQAQGTPLTQDDLSLLLAVAVCISLAGAETLGFALRVLKDVHAQPGAPDNA
jgi:GAF domain-containing protein